jgi:tetratricopeptide (TPR) repeat protein
MNFTLINLLRFLVLLVFVPTFLFAQAETAKPADFETAFNSGISAYQNKRYPEAKEAFNAALGFQKNNVTVLTNLAMTHYQLKETAYAMALLRKAIFLNPNFDVAHSALNFIKTQSDAKELPHTISNWENWRTNVLNLVSFEWLMIFAGLLFGLAGWGWLNWWQKYKKSVAENEVRPSLSAPYLILTLMFLFSIFTAVTKLIAQWESRATIVVEKIEARTLPAADAPSLFELNAGHEVIINIQNESWAQVTYPGGMTGWIPIQSLVQTSGRNLK